jgi:cytochrome P450
MASALPRSRRRGAPGASRLGSAQGMARAELPPGPRLPTAVQTLLFWRSPFRYLELCRKRYGSRFTFRAMGLPPLVFLSDPQEVKTLFAAHPEVLRPGEGGASIMPIVGPSSFMLLDGEEHLFGRRAILPSFQSAAVGRHAEMVSELVRREVASWPRDVCFPLHPRLRALTLEIVLRTIFGAALGADGEERLALLHERLLAMLSITASPLLSLTMLRRGPGAVVWERFLRRRAEVDELIYALVAERAHAARGGGGGGAMNAPGDILAKLMLARNADGSLMNQGQLRDNVMSVILAGHETTASELAWAFQLLAHHPGVQDRLLAEIDADASEDYLTATIQETLRHRPVFLFTIPRAVACSMEIGGIVYRPPTRLLGCIYLMHHDPSRYRRPEEFRPERFLETPDRSDPSAQCERAQAPAWQPWGGGRKRCPGLHMATLEMKTVLRTALSSVSVHAARSMERPLWRSVVVTPHAGSRVILHRRRST